MHIYCVTPVRNGADYIADTIRSVTTQSAVLDGSVTLTYTVRDGFSDDRTPEVARSVGGDLVQVRSARDTGMYDALATAFAEVPESVDYVCYLNAGDLYQPHAFRFLRDIADQDRPEWVSGMPSIISQNGTTIDARLPLVLRRDWIQQGVYGTILPQLQQESQFWSTSLMGQVDLETLRTLRLAGDAYLWRCFADVAAPKVYQAVLGGFRLHGDHLSSDMDLYVRELKSISKPMSLRTRLRANLARPFNRLPNRLKIRSSRDTLGYDRGLADWR